VDAREQLRRYLEQRRDMGERELVLDEMSVEDALRVVAGNAASGKRVDTGGGKREERSGGREERPTRQEPSGDAANDWRAALRATGAEPGLAQSAQASKPASERRAAAPEPPLPASRFPLPALTGGVTQLETLEDIAREVATCTRCPLYKEAKNSVPGEGNAHAQLMCVGEAPGATEDETGRPFVGAAGQLLTKILAAINLPREEVYICNVLKHRPPGNRNPAPDEVTACSPYLIRQIELIKPKVILALGTFAAQTLLNTKTPIGKLRGSVHEYHGVPLVVTYHPAALLRNPGWKRPTWEDVQLARRILDNSSGA
jgi:uracil-DNA glycosylase